MNRNIKMKKTSKSKPAHQRYPYNSPMKFAFTGIYPKQPPNISIYHFQKKKNQINKQYYITGKQNKSKISNNISQSQNQQFSVIDTERFRQKRQTHNHIDIRKNNLNPNLNENIKTVHKSKLRPREPITLGSMKNNKSKLIKTQKDKQTKHQSHYFRKQPFKTKQSKFIPEQEHCDLICTQYLSAGSITQSKVSYTTLHQETTQMDQSQIIEKQKSIIPSRKGIYKSPKLLSPKANVIKKTPEQEIAQFQSKIMEIRVDFQHDSLTLMQSKDEEFTKSKNINCYLGNQIHLDWRKRAIIINWMIEIVAEIGGKRETLANAVNIFDRYMSVSLNIPLNHLQCTAGASLLIASKLQDKFLNASYLCQTSMHIYSRQQIIQEEYKIFSTLNFKVNTPTLNTWANRLAAQWDLYLDTCSDVRNYDIILNNINAIKFKLSDAVSYYNYRWLCQYLDFSIMDINTLSYQPRMLALGYIYLILIMRLNIYTKDQVINNFPYSSQFLMQKSSFNEFFSQFLKQSFGWNEIKSLLPMIQYCATFVILPLKFDLPEGTTQTLYDDEKIEYQNFCSVQTKNQYTLRSITKRNRSIL